MRKVFGQAARQPRSARWAGGLGSDVGARGTLPPSPSSRQNTFQYWVRVEHILKKMTLMHDSFLKHSGPA